MSVAPVKIKRKRPPILDAHKKLAHWPPSAAEYERLWESEDDRDRAERLAGFRNQPVAAPVSPETFLDWKTMLDVTRGAHRRLIQVPLVLAPRLQSLHSTNRLPVDILNIILRYLVPPPDLPLAISPWSMKRVVDDLLADLQIVDVHLDSDALFALHWAAETYLIDLWRNASKFAASAKRITVIPADLAKAVGVEREFVQRIRHLMM